MNINVSCICRTHIQPVRADIIGEWILRRLIRAHRNWFWEIRMLPGRRLPNKTTVWIWICWISVWVSLWMYFLRNVKIFLFSKIQFRDSLQPTCLLSIWVKWTIKDMKSLWDGTIKLAASSATGWKEMSLFPEMRLFIKMKFHRMNLICMKQDVLLVWITDMFSIVSSRQKTLMRMVRQSRESLRSREHLNRVIFCSKTWIMTE